MKSLISYVGDLVLPFNPTIENTKEKKEEKKKTLHGFTQPNLVDQAIEEAVSIWSPLVGIHIPNSSSSKQDNNLSAVKLVERKNKFDERIQRHLAPFKFLLPSEEDEDNPFQKISSIRYLMFGKHFKP
jgi:hypothetical protein